MRLGGRVWKLIGPMTMGLLAMPVVAAATAQGATPGERGTEVVLFNFKLKGTHGYKIEVAAAKAKGLPAGVIVSADRDGLRASYEMRMGFDPGIHAVLGSVSTIAVDFEQRKRAVDRPEKGCTWITETGVFKGQFRFSGELDYTSAERTSMPGEITRLPNGFCGFGDDRPGIRLPPGIFPRETRVTAQAPIPNGSIQFGASMFDEEKGRARFSAETKEILGPLKITRQASATAPRSGTFVLDPGERPRSASVAPPPPFEGSAQLQPSSGSRPTWTGSLQVALPGTPTLALAGPNFAAKLCPSISLLRECKGRPAARQLTTSSNSLG